MSAGEVAVPSMTLRDTAAPHQLGVAADGGRQTVMEDGASVTGDWFRAMAILRGAIPAVGFTACALLLDGLGLLFRLVFLAIGAVSIGLTWREARRSRRAGDGEVALSDPSVGIVVWSALGIPLILGVVLVALAVSGAPDR